MGNVARGCFEAFYTSKNIFLGSRKSIRGPKEANFGEL